MEGWNGQNKDPVRHPAEKKFVRHLAEKNFAANPKIYLLIDSQDTKNNLYLI